MTEENFDNQFATKEDLKDLGLAMKEDLKDLGLAMKEDLKGFRQEMEASFKELGEALHLFANSVDSKFKKVESDITQIKSTMVTKDYLDEKLGDFRGDLTVLVRKEDNKVKALVEVLVEKKVLDQADQKRIYSLEPFAQI